ncbi:MAG: hypothetical protein NVS9B2_05870 [Steroidobacteraceae bacterium]
MTGGMRPFSIEELLAPLPQNTRRGGPGPCVINLSASGLPIALPEKSLAKRAHVFQGHRTEDGGLRYRLRLKRVSAEERQRFSAQPLEARRDVGATGKQAVIEITSERCVRERRSAKAIEK